MRRLVLLATLLAGCATATEAESRASAIKFLEPLGELRSVSCTRATARNYTCTAVVNDWWFELRCDGDGCTIRKQWPAPGRHGADLIMEND